MTYLRHAARHVQQTVIDRVRAGLVADGWLDHVAGAGPFGTDDVTWVATRMSEADMVAVQGNLVAVSFGTEPDDEPQELGGGMTMIGHTLFVDCVGTSESLGLSIASDVKDRLSGLHTDTSRFEPVYDYTTLPRTAVVGYQIEFEQVTRHRSEEDHKALWHTVVADVNVYFTGNE